MITEILKFIGNIDIATTLKATGIGIVGYAVHKYSPVVKSALVTIKNSITSSGIKSDLAQVKLDVAALVQAIKSKTPPST